MSDFSLQSPPEFRCYRVTQVHEMHNERYREYQDYLRFCESGMFWALPDYLRDSVRFDLNWEDDQNPSAEEVKGSKSFQEYERQVRENPPRNVPLEEAASSYVIVTDMTDEDEIRRVVWSMNHHYDVIGLERVEFDPECRYVVTNRRCYQSDEELRRYGYRDEDIARLEDDARWRHCTTIEEVRESYARE